MDKRIGAQLFTLRNFCKTPEALDETLKKVADIGFTAVQLSGVCAYDAEWVAERCREYGLKIVITHFDYNKIINETEETIAFHKKMDCPYIGLGSAKGSMVGDSYNNLVSEIPESAGGGEVVFSMRAGASSGMSVQFSPERDSAWDFSLTAECDDAGVSGKLVLG